LEKVRILTKIVISKKLRKVWVFESKNPVFGSISLEKIRKQGFPNFRKLFYSKLSKNYEKMTLNSNFGNCQKLVRTQKLTRKFGYKFGMQGLNCSQTLQYLWCFFLAVFSSCWLVNFMLNMKNWRNAFAQ